MTPPVPIPEFLTIARLRKAQGRKGEIAADILTDFPDLFAKRSRVFLLAASGDRREEAVERHWFHKNGVILKFKGVETIEQAEALAGREVQIPVSEAAPLDEDAFYIHDLIGCSVIDMASGHKAGIVADVLSSAGSAPLLVLHSEAQPPREHMIPFAAEYLDGVDTSNKIIRMRLPDGLLEVNHANYEDGLRPIGADSSGPQDSNS